AAKGLHTAIGNDDYVVGNNGDVVLLALHHGADIDGNLLPVTAGVVTEDHSVVSGGVEISALGQRYSLAQSRAFFERERTGCLYLACYIEDVERGNVDNVTRLQHRVIAEVTPEEAADISLEQFVFGLFLLATARSSFLTACGSCLGCRRGRTCVWLTIVRRLDGLARLLLDPANDEGYRAVILGQATGQRYQSQQRRFAFNLEHARVAHRSLYKEGSAVVFLDHHVYLGIFKVISTQLVGDLLGERLRCFALCFHPAQDRHQKCAGSSHPNALRHFGHVFHLNLDHVSGPNSVVLLWRDQHG